MLLYRTYPAEGGEPVAEKGKRRRSGRPVKPLGLLSAAAFLLLEPLLLLALSRFVFLQGFAGLFRSGDWLPEYLLLLGPAALLWAAFDRAWCLWLAEGLPLMVLTLVSWYKLLLSGSPLLPQDFSMFSGAGEILGFAFPQLRMTGATLGALLAWLILLVLLVTLPLRGARGGKGLRLSALGLGLILAVVLFALRLPQPETDARCGPVLTLYRSWSQGSAGGSAPGEDEEALDLLREQLAATPSPAPTAPPAAPGPTPEPEPVRPTVIFLMSESFFDVTRLPNVSFERDPLPRFHSLARTSTAGDFFSLTYCGGTGYVEMEVLTGLCSHLLRSGDTLTSLPEEVYRRIPSITDVFLAEGYELTFLHSYNDKLYNRPLIYDALGFGSLRFDDSFPEDAERRGGYSSDLALTEEILAALEEPSDAPRMIFAISMENHQPYIASKYGEECRSGLRSLSLDKEEREALDAYVRGAEDADEALGVLTDALSQREEPVMLIFWGDHRPNLGLADGRNVYQSLGLYEDPDTGTWAPEPLKRMLTTDYLIWTNYGLPKEDGPEGSTLLGLHVLEKLGFPLTDYYAWLRERVDGHCLLYRPRLFVEWDGTALAAVPEEEGELMRLYAAAVYDLVYGEGRIFPSERRREG